MREQRIVRDVREVRSERGDCFAMVVVTRKERSGVLAGDVSPEAMLAKVEA
jgi:precorrin-2/cobalt-factor-2 C20-methyltransferase